MYSCTICGKAVDASLVHEYRADLIGAPFNVVLVDAVRKETCHSCSNTKTVIPDLDGLLHAIALTRAMVARKLSGPEIKFLRHALGWKSKDVAKKLEMSAENWCRVESGTKPLGPQSEKLFRVHVLVKAMRQGELAADVATKVANALDAKIEAHWDPNDVLELRFVRRGKPDAECGDDDGIWVEPKEQELRVA